VNALQQQSRQDNSGNQQPLTVQSSPSPPVVPTPIEDSTPHQTPISEKRWPDVYTLPPLPTRLREDLLSAESLVEADDAVLRRLVQILFEDMSQFTL